MKKVIALSVVFLMVMGVQAQMSNAQFNKSFTEANQLMQEKLWNKAADIWMQLVAEQQFNGNINYKLGRCLMETSNKKSTALPYLETAVSVGISKNYDPFDPAEEKAPIEAQYYYGRALHLDYQLDKAISTYNQLLADIPKKHRLVPMAERQIEMCNQAVYQVNNPKNYSISNVGELLNGEYKDYGPVVSIDEQTLFFTSRRLRQDSTNINITDDDTGEMKEDIYVSYKSRENEWSKPELLNINNDGHAAAISVSPDAQTLYIYYDTGGDGDIYKSQLVGESWTIPELMFSDINSDAWETHITVAADEKSLYFISDRENGYGGRDIYRCVKLPNGDWSKALNVGPSLNTPYDEDAVFLSADGRTLYFSSNGHTSMGDFDIFYSNLNEETQEWSKPENIGYPLNTTDADVFFYPTANGKRAYYSSAKEGGYGLQDLYVIDMPESSIESELSVLKGYVYPPEGEKLPENSMVIVTNKNTGEVTEYKVRQRDGSYVAILPPCVAYEIEYLVNDELVEQEFINVPCESGYQTIDKEVFLLPVQLEQEEIPNITSGTTASNDSGSCEETIAALEAEIASLRAQLKNNTGSNTTDNSATGGIDTGVITSEYDGAKAIYERYFVYDFSDFNKQEKKFDLFISNLKKVINSKGEATVFIEASASTVPSSKYANNKKLAESRAEKAKQKILTTAAKNGISKDKIKFSKPLARVQGPEYKNDAVQNRATYELYQYIKISAE
ncbi:MAG: hypothetical protein AB8B53_07675 [Flavobacteriales bacterium]